MKTIILILILFVNSLVSAQTDIRVQEFEINGSLKISDPISTGLGRINAVELNLSEGDRLYSKLTADFLPLLVLVPPSGKYKIMYPDESTYAAVFDDKIDESGKWLMYIVGDSTATGKYLLINKFASSNAVNFDKTGDFCDLIKLLLAHEKAHFYFVKGIEIDDSGKWLSKLKPENSKDSFIYGNTNEYFKSLIFQSGDLQSAEKKFLRISNKTGNCFNTGWDRVENDWHTVIGKTGISEKIILFKEKTGDKRYLKILLSKEQKENNKNKYSISLIVSNLK